MANGVTARTESMSNPPLVLRGWNCQKGSDDERQPVFDRLSKEEEELSENLSVVGPHWLRGSLPDREFGWGIERMQTLFGADYETKPWGVYKYDRQRVFAYGARILYQSCAERSEITGGRFTIEIPGKALDSLPQWYLGSLIKALPNHDFHLTRLDLYWDDKKVIIEPHEIVSKVYERGPLGEPPARADFMGFRHIEVSHGADKYGGVMKDMVTFGRRGSQGSGKTHRIYDKRIESGDLRAGIRHETELCRAYGITAFEEIAKTWDVLDTKPVTALIGSIIGGAIDFKHRTERVGDKHLDRLERYSFKQTINDAIGSAKLARKKVVESVQKAIEWFEKDCVGIMQMGCEAYGEKRWLSKVIDWANKRDRMRPRHYRLVEEYRQQQRQGGSFFEKLLAGRSPPEREKELEAALVRAMASPLE